MIRMQPTILVILPTWVVFSLSLSLPPQILSKSTLSQQTVNKTSWSNQRQTRICYIFWLWVIIKALWKQISLGLRAKRAYIEFWPLFIFCRIELIFGRLTCFDMESNVPQLFRSICASFSRNNVCKKTQLSSGDPLFNEKQKKPFVSLSFICHIITVISYCCFVSTSD